MTLIAAAPAPATGAAAEHRSLRDEIRELERRSRPLEPDEAERRRLRDAVVASSERFLEAIDDLPGFVETADAGAGLSAVPFAERGLPIEPAIELIEEQAIRPGTHPAAAGHLAFIGSGGLYHSALADFLAAVSNKFGGLFFTGPGLVRMENLLVRWVADLLGYPAGAGGSILSGGSLATLTAITAARDAHGLAGAGVASAVVYATGQTHHSLHKALRIAGLGAARLRTVAVDERYRMSPGALAEAIAADRARGLEPWLIAATAGSTDAGAVDPLDEIADVAARERCWLHVDAAYGGFFLLTGRGQELMLGIERSDSAVLDPHKSLFLPWGAGIVVVREVRSLTAVHGTTGSYLQDAGPGSGPADEISPADVSPELTRPFRALRLWLPLVQLGLAPFRAALEEKLLLARHFHAEVQRIGFAAGPPPDLSIVTYRWAPPGATPEEADRRNRKILEGVRRDGGVFLSSTVLDGRFTLRMAATGHRTHLPAVERALAVLGAQAAALAGGSPAPTPARSGPAPRAGARPSASGTPAGGG